MINSIQWDRIAMSGIHDNHVIPSHSPHLALDYGPSFVLQLQYLNQNVVETVILIRCYHYGWSVGGCRLCDVEEDGITLLALPLRPRCTRSPLISIAVQQ